MEFKSIWETLQYAAKQAVEQMSALSNEGETRLGSSAGGREGMPMFGICLPESDFFLCLWGQRRSDLLIGWLSD